MAKFASEPAEAQSDPFTPPHRVDSARRRSGRAKWVATGLISGGIAAFAAGAFVYIAYPQWSEEAAHKTIAPSITHQAPERPVATNGKPTSSAATINTPPRRPEAARNSSPPEAPRKQAPAAEATDSDFPSLTGQWAMNTRVESSALKRYQGLHLEYHVRLQQVGSQITGDGFKTRENDRAVRTRTPITLIGDVIGDRVVLNFEERGSRRKSAGRLVLDRESEDVLRGRFSSDAAKSTGVADARR